MSTKRKYVGGISVIILVILMGALVVADPCNFARAIDNTLCQDASYTPQLAEFANTFRPPITAVSLTSGSTTSVPVEIFKPQDTTNRYFLYKKSYYRDGTTWHPSDSFTAVTGTPVTFFDNPEANNAWIEITRVAGDQTEQQAATFTLPVTYQAAATTELAVTMCQCDTSLNCEIQDNWDCNSADGTKGIFSNRWMAEEITLNTLCGNGIPDTGEECDNGAANGENAICNTDCTINFCVDNNPSTFEFIIAPDNTLHNVKLTTGLEDARGLPWADIQFQYDATKPQKLKIVTGDVMSAAPITQNFGTVTRANCDALWDIDPPPYKPHLKTDPHNYDVSPQTGETVCAFISQITTKIKTTDEDTDGSICVQWELLAKPPNTGICTEDVNGIVFFGRYNPFPIKLPVTLNTIFSTSCSSSSILSKGECRFGVPRLAQTTCALGCINAACKTWTYTPFQDLTNLEGTGNPNTKKWSAFSTHSTKPVFTQVRQGSLYDLNAFDTSYSTASGDNEKAAERYFSWIHVEPTDQIATASNFFIEMAGGGSDTVTVLIDGTSIGRTTTIKPTEPIPLLTPGWHSIEVIVHKTRATTTLLPDNSIRTTYGNIITKFQRNEAGTMINTPFADVVTFMTHYNFDYNSDNQINLDDLAYYTDSANAQEIFSDPTRTTTQTERTKLTCIINNPTNNC